jgi:hypothetical protein
MNQALQNLQLAKSQIKLNRRGLTELMLACAFLSLLTFALWSWQNGGHVVALDAGAMVAEASLLPLITRHPAIMFSVIVTEFIVLLALTLAFVPITWWLRTDAVLPRHHARATTPLRWLGEKLHLLPPPSANVEAEVAGEYIVTETGERIFVPNANPEMEEDQEVVMVEQEDGTLLAMVKQEDGTLAPAPTKPKEGGAEGESTEPLLPLPEQANDVLNFDEEEEEDPLADLADIGDILNSAFDDESAIDPEREALSQSLEEVAVMDLLFNARQVLATFTQ